MQSFHWSLFAFAFLFPRWCMFECTLWSQYVCILLSEWFFENRYLQQNVKIENDSAWALTPNTVFIIIQSDLKTDFVKMGLGCRQDVHFAHQCNIFFFFVCVSSWAVVDMVSPLGRWTDDDKINQWLFLIETNQWQGCSLTVAVTQYRFRPIRNAWKLEFSCWIYNLVYVVYVPVLVAWFIMATPVQRQWKQ